MVPIRNRVIISILLFNIAGISLNFYFISNKYSIRFLEEKSQTSYDKYNLRGSKIKIDESNYFGKSKINENILKENIRILRKLYIDEHEFLALNALMPSHT